MDPKRTHVVHESSVRHSRPSTAPDARNLRAKPFLYALRTHSVVKYAFPPFFHRQDLALPLPVTAMHHLVHNVFEQALGIALIFCVGLHECEPLLADLHAPTVVVRGKGKGKVISKLQQ